MGRAFPSKKQPRDSRLIEFSESEWNGKILE